MKTKHCEILLEFPQKSRRKEGRREGWKDRGNKGEKEKRRVKKEKSVFLGKNQKFIPPEAKIIYPYILGGFFLFSFFFSLVVCLVLQWWKSCISGGTVSKIEADVHRTT